MRKQKKATPRRAITLESFAGRDMLKMKPTELIDYSLSVMRYVKAKPSRLRGMIHGQFISRRPEGDTLSHGLCGCAVGAIAIYDGENARAMMARNNHVPHAEEWQQSAEFGFDLMASLSRAYEGSAMNRMIRMMRRSPGKVDEYRDLGNQPATKEDVNAVIRRLTRLRPIVKKQIEPNMAEYSNDGWHALEDVDPEWGQDGYIPDDARDRLNDMVEHIDMGVRPLPALAPRA